MKKLIIGLAVVAMAITSEAAVAKWMVANMRTPVATDPTQAETGIIPDSKAAFLSSLAVDLYYNGAKITDGETNANGAVPQSQFWTAEQTIAAAQAAGSNTLGFDIAATYTDANGTYVYAGHVTSDLTNVINGAKDVTVTFNGATAGSWTFTPGASPIPEPTSGLLLLLGVAGLALRRRRA